MVKTDFIVLQMIYFFFEYILFVGGEKLKVYYKFLITFWAEFGGLTELV